MTLNTSPGSLRIASVLLFGGLMAARTEFANHWVRALFAAGAFVVLGLAWRLPRRPLHLSLRAHRQTRRPK